MKELNMESVHNPIRDRKDVRHPFRLLVVTVSDRIVVFACYLVVFASYLVGPRWILLDRLSVSPSRQGKGLGRLLIDRFVLDYRIPIVLEVNELNVSARAFYQRLQFREIANVFPEGASSYRLLVRGGNEASDAEIRERAPSFC